MMLLFFEPYLTIFEFGERWKKMVSVCNLLQLTVWHEKVEKTRPIAGGRTVYAITIAQVTWNDTDSSLRRNHKARSSKTA